MTMRLGTFTRKLAFFAFVLVLATIRFQWQREGEWHFRMAWAAAPQAGYPCISLWNWAGPNGLGTSDDGPTFNKALVATAGTGNGVCVPYIPNNSGAYLIQTAIVPVSNTTLLLAENSTLQGTGSLTGNGLIAFTATPVSPTSTTLAANIGGAQIGPPQVTFTVVNATGFAIGGTAKLESVDGWPQGYYGITNVVGTTITVDRPIVWPFQTGDLAAGMAADPTLQHAAIIGLGSGGATITGGGSTHGMFIIGHKHCKVANLRCVPPTSGLSFSTACFGEQLGWDTRMEDLYAVSTAGFATGKGYSLGSDENEHVERCVSVSPDGAVGANYEIYDETSLHFSGNVGLNSNGECFLLGTETSDTSRPGTVDSNFDSNVCIIGTPGSNPSGIKFVNNSSRNTWTNTLIAANNYPSSQMGVYFDGGSSDNNFTGLNVYNTLLGIVFDTINSGNNRNKFANVTFGGTTGNWYQAVKLQAGNPGSMWSNISIVEGYTGNTQIAASSDSTWDGVTGSVASETLFSVGAAHLTLSRANIAVDAASAAGTMVATTSSSSIVDLDRVVCTLTNNGICVSNGGGTINLRDVTGSGTGTGLVANGGSASVNVLDGFTNLNGFSTPFTNTSGSTYTATSPTGIGGGWNPGATTITTTSGTFAATALQASPPLQIISSSLVNNVTVQEPNITNGFWYFDIAGVTFNGHNLVLECGTGATAVTLSALTANEDIYMCRCDGSNHLDCNL